MIGIGITALATRQNNGSGSIPLLDNPRLGTVGPSTAAQALYGASATPYRAGNTDVGPITWLNMLDRRVDFRNFAKTTTPYYDGDHQAVYGATQDLYPAQIQALANRFSGNNNWIAYYEIGRNDIQNNAATMANLQSWMARDVASLRAAGAKRILLANLWKKPAVYGGVWASGGAARATVDQFNAWLPGYVAANSDLVLVDFAAALTDPASPIGDPYTWVYRNATAGGYTHYSAIGAQRAAQGALIPAMAKVAKPRAYPARPAESLISALSGTTGTKTNVTGNVATGWDLTQTAATATVTASQETINGETYQVSTITAATGTGANGGQLSFSKVGNIAVAAGKKVGIRCKVLVPASAVPYGLVIGLGSATGQGDASQARAFAIIPQTNDDPTTVIAAPGAAWAATPKFDGSVSQELWVETSSYVLGATGGSSVAVSIGVLFGPAASAGDALIVKVGQIQTFEVP